MNQLAMNFTAPALHTRARRTDPETSHKAAAKASKFAASHAGRILLALQQHGPRSAHGLSLLIGLGLSVVQIDRRTVELQRLKLIVPTGAVEAGFRVWAAVV